MDVPRPYKFKQFRWAFISQTPVVLTALVLKQEHAAASFNPSGPVVKPTLELRVDKSHKPKVTKLYLR